jgi:hypothetical protein
VPPPPPGKSAAEFLRFDTTLVNHNAVPAGSSFTNRWTFRNNGETVWDGSFELVHAPVGPDSAPLANPTEFNLADVTSPWPVARGAEATITLAMNAPEAFGRRYRSRWELRDRAGEKFGHLFAEITVVPASTIGTGVQRADMTFIADHTVTDDTRLAAGAAFDKQWRVRNSGNRNWSNAFRLVFVEGDLGMARGVASHISPPAGRGEEVILSIPMVAPPPRDNQPTTYASLWRMQDDRRNFFGQAVWARIVSLPAELDRPAGRFDSPAGWYSQLDPRWKDDRLGHGQETIGSWGCLLACQAMMLTAYGLAVTPPELNRRLLQVGPDGFQGSVVQFVAPTLLLPGLTRAGNLRSQAAPALPFTDWTGEDPIARIDAALATGHTVIAQVDRDPNDAFYHADTEQHWVVLVARTADGSDYLMLDPMTPPGQVGEQPRSLMLKYGRRIPSRSNEDNLRRAIKSALVYRYRGMGPAG